MSKFKQIIYGKKVYSKESQILYKSKEINKEDEITTILSKIDFKGKDSEDQTFKYFPIGNGNYALMRVLFFSGKERGYVDERNQILAHCIIFDEKKAIQFIKNMDFFIENIKFVNHFNEIAKYKYIDNCKEWREIVQDFMPEECSVVKNSIKKNSYSKYVLAAIIEKRQLIFSEKSLKTYDAVFDNVPANIAKENSVTFCSNSPNEINSFNIAILSEDAFSKIRESGYMNLPINVLVVGKDARIKETTKKLIKKYEFLLEKEPLALEEMAENAIAEDFWNKIRNYKIRKVTNVSCKEDIKVATETEMQENSAEKECISHLKKEESVVEAKRKIKLAVNLTCILICILGIIAMSDLSIDNFNITLTINDSWIELLLSGVIGYLIGNCR